MKAKIDFEVDGDELHITRYYEKSGITLRVPLADLPEVIKILARFVKEVSV
jgi:hypothetical protein